MLYTGYILYSEKNNKIYIGYTSHLVNRFRSHNEFGKDWTKNFRPWKVIYCEYFENKPAAMKREKQLKGAAARKAIRVSIETELIKGYINCLY